MPRNPVDTTLVWTCLLSLLLIGGRAAAAPVAITNPSFETPALGDGGFTTGSITGWTATGSAAKGVFNPTMVQLVPPTDGVQVAYLDGGGTAVTLAQTLSTTVAAGETYVLETDFAYRLNSTATEPPFTLELLAGGSVVASFDGRALAGAGPGLDGVASGPQGRLSPRVAGSHRSEPGDDRR